MPDETRGDSKVKAFTDAYKARYGAETHALAAQSYAGLMMALRQLIASIRGLE